MSYDTDPRVSRYGPTQDSRIGEQQAGYSVTRDGVDYQVLKTETFGWIICTGPNLDYARTSDGGFAVGFATAYEAIDAVLADQNSDTSSTNAAYAAGDESIGAAKASEHPRHTQAQTAGLTTAQARLHDEVLAIAAGDGADCKDILDGLDAPAADKAAVAEVLGGPDVGRDWLPTAGSSYANDLRVVAQPDGSYHLPGGHDSWTVRQVDGQWYATADHGEYTHPPYWSGTTADEAIAKLIGEPRDTAADEASTADEDDPNSQLYAGVTATFRDGSQLSIDARGIDEEGRQRYAYTVPVTTTPTNYGDDPRVRSFGANGYTVTRDDGTQYQVLHTGVFGWTICHGPNLDYAPTTAGVFGWAFPSAEDAISAVLGEQDTASTSSADTEDDTYQAATEDAWHSAHGPEAPRTARSRSNANADDSLHAHCGPADSDGHDDVDGM